ncbi:unnamed protein product [Protopolystoma xenopodis]|uniref:Uncharacterized protein n=1 Tax=Protopolystoma xenopodis TaxID=117903 RepID=A0A3S5B298_9PLAT|nr:unnamed protein product [Protopolystoma xenopodis]
MLYRLQPEVDCYLTDPGRLGPAGTQLRTDRSTHNIIITVTRARMGYKWACRGRKGPVWPVLRRDRPAHRHGVFETPVVLSTCGLEGFGLARQMRAERQAPQAHADRGTAGTHQGVLVQQPNAASIRGRSIRLPRKAWQLDRPIDRSTDPPTNRSANQPVERLCAGSATVHKLIGTDGDGREEFLQSGRLSEGKDSPKEDRDGKIRATSYGRHRTHLSVCPVYTRTPARAVKPVCACFRVKQLARPNPLWGDALGPAADPNSVLLWRARLPSPKEWNVEEKSSQ